MDYLICRQLLVFMFFLSVTMRVATCCQQTPECVHASDAGLKVAINEGNTIAVCRILPLNMHCLQEALNLCQNDVSLNLDAQHGGSKPDIRYFQRALDDMKVKFTEMYFWENLSTRYVLRITGEDPVKDWVDFWENQHNVRTPQHRRGSSKILGSHSHNNNRHLTNNAGVKSSRMVFLLPTLLLITFVMYIIDILNYRP